MPLSPWVFNIALDWLIECGCAGLGMRRKLAIHVCVNILDFTSSYYHMYMYYVYRHDRLSGFKGAHA